MNTQLILGVFALAAGAAFASATVKDVKVTQNWPWNGKVNIDYTIEAPAGALVDIDIVLRNGTRRIDIGWGAHDASRLYSQTAGTYRVTWDPAKTVGNTAPVWFEFTAEVTVANNNDMFLVIDLEGDDGAGHYPVTFTDTPPAGGWNTDEYKTTKLVMRRIPAGTFTMGSPYDEIGRANTDSRGPAYAKGPRTEALHPVTFTNFFYVGIFEMTEKQYCLIEGIGGGSTVAVANYANGVITNGIDILSLRGANSKTQDVFPAYEADSFFGRLNTKFALTGKLANYVFDLPSISQAEYACRAGTTTTYYNGFNSSSLTNDVNLTPLAWYRNATWWRTRTVGGKLPNAFGLYDTLGNANELCLDVVPDGTILWWQEGVPLVEPILYDPDHWPWPSVVQGGDEEQIAKECRAACKNSGGSGGRNVGFRLALVARRK